MNTASMLGRDYTAPSDWDELNVKQLIIWVKLLGTEMSSEIAMLIATRAFYDIQRKIFFKLTPVQQFELSNTLGFLLGQNKLVTWIIPSIRIRFKEYLGPDNRLSNCTINEYRFCELYYHAYRRTKKENFLDQLISTLYRPLGVSFAGDDLRDPLTDIGVRVRAKKMHRLKESVRQAILFNYEGCQAYICKRYPMIFQASGEPSKALPDMQGLIKTVAGGKFGNFVETEKTGLYLFLDHIKDEMAQTPQ